MIHRHHIFLLCSHMQREVERYATPISKSLTPEQMQISTRLFLLPYHGREDTRLVSRISLVSRVLLVSLVLCDRGSELTLPIIAVSNWLSLRRDS
jgi:hypothetical protein